MRFEVLGPLTVRTDDGTPVPVPEAKVRALLAALLVREGRPVPAYRLIDDLWGGAGAAAPGNPGNTLQTKVSQLRRTLAEAEDGARSLIAYGPAGYALRAPAQAVDADRFTDLAAAARKAAEPRARAELLARALGLWQGEAYADFRDADFTQAAITRLEEQRITAYEDLAEARLELGEHHTLADELTELAEAHPLRQRLRGSQMRALYRAGRQNEALAVYARLRGLFAEELGIDPGAELAALYEAILRQDPALTGPPVPAAPLAPQAVPPAPTAPTDPAVARARAYGGGNLPTPVSSLVGREEAVVRVCAALGAGRLVTLCGPGGVGKTRLALAAAARLEEAHPDGVWFVELAGAQGTSVAEAVAAAIGMREDDAGGGRVEERLAEALRRRAALLVLDNCEHLLPAAAALTERLLRHAPGLRVLATSQEPLALSGEVIEAVQPLAEAQAIELFAARAAAAAPGFTLGPDTAGAVALICRRLDGIPLALELAATRVRVLGVEALAERLHDRFRLLNQVRRDAPARQRTLRAMIDWSWELLSPAEATALRRLSVFAGGFTLEAAEAVCADGDPAVIGDTAGSSGADGGVVGGVARGDVLDLVTRLVDCSLVVSAYGDSRLRLLESVAAYGLEQLHAAGETGAARQRHAEYYTGFAERAAERLHGPEQGEWLRRLDREGLNARSALEHTGAGELGLRLVTAQSWYWFLRGRIQEAADATGTAGATALHAAFALLSGDDSHLGGDFSAAGLREQWLLAYARCGFGSGVQEDELIFFPEQFRETGDRWGEAVALLTLSTRALYDGDLAALRRNAEAAAAVFTELGDRWGQLQASEQLGILAEVAGDYAAASRLHEDGVRDAQALELWTHASFRLARQGRIALLTGDLAQAAVLHERALRLAEEQCHRPAEQFATLGLALGARRGGDLDGAEARLRPWLDWNQRLGVDSGAALILAELGYVAELRAEPDAAESLHREGLAAARRSGDPRALALALEGLAGILPHARAASLLGTATALRASVGTPRPRAERADTDRATIRAGTALGTEAFATAFTAGEALPLAEQLALLGALQGSTGPPPQA
ncbi:AfsR/SARP family transcriptional regulator [Streptomyces sp. H34-S4]|uniref:AfsR/SARP family transcriptional regulator n=1 Tax=Streptomyces sp. H34-S4 TaxID=2996463 RepID=UPI00226EC467|nr:BTAD domain-containing putative transcriptional regulator [Streptomyces sp. H34-S4]MCY0936144.1 BTAD domain-containing putative transcriptional regulator [Streptomyces sp. H34-S4]